MTDPNNVKITDVDVVGRRIPLTDEFPVSYGEDVQTEHAFVRLQTDAGLIGYGEGTALPWFTGETTDGMVDIIDRWLTPKLHEETIEAAHANSEAFLDSFPAAPGAKAAVELALLDLRGKCRDLPVRELLGPTVRKTAPMIAIVPGVAPETAESLVRDAAQDGFRRFKVKATGSIASDIDRINAVLAAMPADATVRVDANTGWEQYPTAMRVIDGLTGLERIEYFEQPVHPDRTADLRRIWEDTGVRVFGDESVHGPGDVEQLGQTGEIAGIHLKLAKTGSLARLREMAGIADRHGLEATVVSAFGSSLDTAALLQLAATVPNLSAACELIPDLLETDPSSDPIAITPSVEIPNNPGLGVDLPATLFE